MDLGVVLGPGVRHLPRIRGNLNRRSKLIVEINKKRKVEIRDIIEPEIGRQIHSCHRLQPGAIQCMGYELQELT
jgi:hypothetical protein